MGKALASMLLVLLLNSFTVFALELETLPPTYPPHKPAPLHPPANSPSSPPANAPHHHHHHHHHSPAPAPVTPPAKPPSSPAPATPPAKPPSSPAPATPPAKPPSSPAPAKPPTHQHYPPPLPSPAPVNPPVHPYPRSFIAVQGVVYLKSCKYAGVDTLLGATPLLGAVVKLQCNNTKYKLVEPSKTDKNGYFFIEAPKSITTFGAHKCNVVLASATYGLKPSNLHGGLTGAVLRPEKPYVSHGGLPFMLYTVGPLAFEPKCPR